MLTIALFIIMFNESQNCDNITIIKDLNEIFLSLYSFCGKNLLYYSPDKYMSLKSYFSAA